MQNYIITFKLTTSEDDAKQLLVDHDIVINNFFRNFSIVSVSMTGEQSEIIKNNNLVEAVEPDGEKSIILPVKSSEQPMDLTRVKKELNKQQVGQKPDWRDKTKMRDYEDKGIWLLKHENVSFVVDGYTFAFQEDFGGEGQGDDYWVVFSVTKEDYSEFYKVPGWYASHHGGELEVENTYAVQPVEKVITVWEVVK